MNDARLIVLAWMTVVFVAMALEAARSARHERQLRARGALEPPDDVIGLMSWAYPASFVLMAIEGWWRRVDAPALLVAGAAVFVAAKAIKYAAMHALGDRWSFRVLVLPGVPLVRKGPYRRLRHPNYVGVMGELLGTAVGLGALWSGAGAVVGFALLLRRRIAVEERALGLRLDPRQRARTEDAAR